MDSTENAGERKPQAKKSAAGLATADEGVSDSQLRWREALVLWLRWNQVYERVTEQMFAIGDDPARLQALMDEADGLRRQAIALSQELLG